MAKDESNCPTETHAPTPVAEEQRKETCGGIPLHLQKAHAKISIEL